MSTIPGFDRDPVTTVSEALRYLSPSCDRCTWVTVGMAVKSVLGENGFSVWDEWSQASANYCPKDARATWKSLKDSGRVTVATLFYLAKCAGWTRQHTATLLPVPAPDSAQLEAQAREERERHLAIAKKARYLLDRSPLVDTHPYLTRKGLRNGHGARLRYGKLVLPMFAFPDDWPTWGIMNLQFIAADGTKRFMRDGRKAGCFWRIGAKTPKAYLAEGFATAASIHHATGCCCYVAFDAGNLPAVAKIIAAQDTVVKHLVVCADHDATGLRYAKLAAAMAFKLDTTVVVPPERGMDFNDLYQRATLERRLKPSIDGVERLIVEWGSRHGRT